MILDCQILVSTEKGRAYSFSCHGNMTTCPNKLFYTIKSGIDLFFLCDHFGPENALFSNSLLACAMLYPNIHLCFVLSDKEEP
jgi:hypothetical protein